MSSSLLVVVGVSKAGFTRSLVDSVEGTHRALSAGGGACSGEVSGRTGSAAAGTVGTVRVVRALAAGPGGGLVLSCWTRSLLVDARLEGGGAPSTADTSPV